MIDRINTSVAVGVDRATKRAADALEKVTNRIAGEADNAVDRGVSIRMSAKYSENYLNARNAQDSISYHQTREGALGSVSGMLLQLRDLSAQMGSPVLNESDKGLIRQQAETVMNDIDSFASSAEFNSSKILKDVSAAALGIDGLDFGSSGTTAAIDSALEKINSKRASAGASISTLEVRIDNLVNRNLNLAESIEGESGSFIEDVIELTESVNQAAAAIKTADIVLDLDKEKVKGLLEMM